MRFTQRKFDHGSKVCITFDTKKPIKDYIYFVNATELQCITN